jgi:hypothetical protein
MGINRFFGVKISTKILIHRPNPLQGIPSNISLRLDQSTIQSYTCTTEPTLSCLIADLARENTEIALIVATAIAISIVVYAVSKSVALIITAWRSSQ